MPTVEILAETIFIFLCKDHIIPENIIYSHVHSHYYGLRKKILPKILSRYILSLSFLIWLTNLHFVVNIIDY